MAESSGGRRFAVVHGYRRAFRVVGSGPPLVLLHGIGDSSRTWRRVLEPLSEGRTVIAPDLLGHGDSDKPRADYSAAAYACGLRDLLAVLDVDRATVVGHSLGGGVAMQFAYQFPERCDRLVLVSTGGVGREVHPLLRLAAAPGAEAVLPLLTGTPLRLASWALGPVGRWFVERGVDVLRLGDDLEHVLDCYAALATPQQRASFLRTLRSVVDLRGQVVTMLDRCYLAAGLPTLLVWGGQDRVVPVEHAGVAHRAMPGSRLEVIPDAGHFPQLSHPERFAAVLRDFLDRTAPAEHDPERWRRLLRSGGTR